MGCKEGRALNRVVRWTPAGIEYEADSRQAEKLIGELKLDGANGTHPQCEGDISRPVNRHSPFRAIAVRANYVSVGRSEIQFGAK